MSGSFYDDLRWLKEHPQFEFRPASIDEFLGTEYLGIYDRVRPGVKGVLYDIFGKEAQEDRISIVERAIMTGAIGIGKNFRPDELVLTPQGNIPIGLLIPGDSIIGKDGKTHNVTGVFQNEDIQYYRMKFCDGTEIDCGEDHLWEVRVATSGNKSTVISTKEMVNRGLTDSRGKYRFSLPNVDRVDFEEEDIIIPPYSWGVIAKHGVLIGDRLHVLVEDQRIIDRITQELANWARLSVSYLTPVFRRCDNGFGNQLFDELSRLDPDESKRTLDIRYLWGKSLDRLQYLRGLMDAKISNGQKFNDRHFYYQTQNQVLLHEIMHLVRSLGGYSKIVTRKKGVDRFHSAYVNIPDGPFWAFSGFNGAPYPMPTNRRIVEINKIDKGDGVCISVDSADSLYVARDFIVTHNTTFASIALPYMAHWVLCLKDPQSYYNLLPGSRIAFMQMSTSEQQAREVIFGDIDARIKNAPWFSKHYPRDPRYTKQIRFPKDIWIIPGDSAETTFEGYNILGGILDEADSHKVVKEKDYGQIGMETIENRIKSRYVDHSDPNREGHKGLLIVIGQMKSQFGLASRVYSQYKEDPRALAVRMAIWESFGWSNYEVDGERNSFWYDVKRKRILDSNIAAKVGAQDGHIIEVPKQYLYEFTVNPEKALKDLGGIPPGAADPFISQVAKIDDANDRWNMNHLEGGNPVESKTISPKILDSHIVSSPSIRRAAHMDFAYSATGDSAAIAVGHIKKMIENVYGDLAPYIVIDLIIRTRAAPGEQVLLSDMRSYVYQLMKKFGYKIHRVTLDGFQSIDTMQQFRKRRIYSDYLSVDRSKEPYEAFRDALYEDRIEFPSYMTWINYQSELKGDGRIDILRRELISLQDVGTKIDHPPGGSKDVADAVAAVVSSLMSDSTYRKGVPSERNSIERVSSSPSLDELFKDFEVISASNAPMLGEVGRLTLPNLRGLTTGDRIPKRFRP